MSIWCTGTGIVTVLKSDHISLEKVFNETFKGCDRKFKLEQQSTDCLYRVYKISFSVDLEYSEFLPKWDIFVKKCKPTSCDIDLTLRQVL